MKFWLLVAGAVGAPVTLIAKIVTLAAKMVTLANAIKSNKEDADKAIQETRAQAMAAMAAHERLCEERMRSLLAGQQLMLAGLQRVEDQIGSL